MSKLFTITCQTRTVEQETLLQTRSIQPFHIFDRDAVGHVSDPAAQS